MTELTPSWIMILNQRDVVPFSMRVSMFWSPSICVRSSALSQSSGAVKSHVLPAPVLAAVDEDVEEAPPVDELDATELDEVEATEEAPAPLAEEALLLLEPFEALEPPPPTWLNVELTATGSAHAKYEARTTKGKSDQSARMSRRISRSARAQGVFAPAFGVPSAFIVANFSLKACATPGTESLQRPSSFARRSADAPANEASRALTDAHIGSPPYEARACGEQ